MSGHELAMALRCAYLAMHRRTDVLVAPAGITADQFVVLSALSDGEALTQRELVTRTSSDPNTLRAMLVLLDGQGLVRRKPHPTDGRARSVSLSRKGRDVLQKAWQRSELFRTQLFEAFSPMDCQQLVSQLQGLVEKIDRKSLASLSSEQ